MFESLLNNPFFTGTGVIALGAALKDKPMQIFYRVREEFLSQLTLEESSDSLSGLKEWIIGRLHNKRTRQVFKDNQMRVAPGTYWAGFYRKTPLWVNFSRVESKALSYSGDPTFRDTFTLTFLTRNHRILSDFVQELTDICQNKRQKDKIKVYFNCKDGDFGEFNLVKKRSLDSVVLPNQLKQSILQDIESFKSKEEWYSSIGVPWRRGYMLYGPPGNGKSSLVASLAGKFDANLKVINLSNLINDAALMECFGAVHNGDFVLLEDADCITRAGFSNFSLSTLLNAIDGVGTKDGRILFLTTNKPDELDEALVRPGRLDRKFHIQNATKEQAYQLYYRFFGKAPDNLTIEDYQYSMAELQEKFLEEAMNEVQNKSL